MFTFSIIACTFSFRCSHSTRFCSHSKCEQI
nr:MAG TPA: hypothetical protein [Caudoviricetes sp.]